MFNLGNESKSYGVKYQARCIAPQLGTDGPQSKFLVGTLSLRDENEVHLIQYFEGANEIVCEGLFSHQAEIWDLSCCPFDQRLLATVYSAGGQYGAAIWQIPRGASGVSSRRVGPISPTRTSSLPALEKLVSLEGHTSPVKGVLWFPSSKHEQVVSIDEETLRLWSIDQEKAVASVHAQAAAGDLQQLETGRWDPHDVNMLATASETYVDLWDLRVMKQVQRLDQVHAMQVRDIDYNPKKQYTMMTTGDDSRIRFWDIRSTGMPLRELSGHSHWTWRARYNPFYDELVLSAGTDTVVNLWSVPSIAASKGRNNEGEKPHPASPSSPFGSPRGPLDGIAQAYTEHEDSVYGIAWSAKDPWVFASLSYDGRVVVDVVPAQIRKKLKD